MKKYITKFILFCIILTPNALQAWTSMSHVVVSFIVEKHLSSNAKNRMCEIYENIEGEFPMETDWTSSFYWFRKIVNDSLFHLYDWQLYPRPYDPEGILSSEKEKLYFASFSKNSVVSSLNGAAKVLRRSKCGAWERNFMLRILINGVLDIHQPCKCANLYSSKFPFGNECGYTYMVVYKDRLYNLVELWDSLFGEALVDSERYLDYDQYIKAQKIAQELMDSYPLESYFCQMNGTFEDWAEESYQLAHDVYEGIEDTSTVAESYIARCQPIAKRQLALAAYRLTFLLEKTFGKK